MSESTFEELSEELEAILPSKYELNKDKLEITRVDCVSVTIEDFKELAKILPSSYKLELADKKIVIMPVGSLTGQREAVLITRVTNWCLNNRRIVGRFGSSQSCYNLPLTNPVVRGPDASVVLIARWNTLSVDDHAEAFPPVAPNFVAEIRSDNDSWEYCHNKMLVNMDSGVDEGILIDPIDQTLTWYQINGNNIVWSTRNNPRSFSSRILNGFTLDLRDII